MASNNLTAEQDILARQFFVEVAQVLDEPRLQYEVLTLLGYVNVGGKFVSPTKVPKGYRFGGTFDVKCEWGADTDRVLAYLEEKKLAADNNNNTNKARNRKPRKDSEVRETVLREDV